MSLMSSIYLKIFMLHHRLQHYQCSDFQEKENRAQKGREYVNESSCTKKTNRPHNHDIRHLISKKTW